MKTRLYLPFAALLPVTVFAQTPSRYAGERPPVSQSIPAAASSSVLPAPQRLYTPGDSLIAPEKAQQVVEAFRAAYAKLGSPRMVIAVNRELVDSGSGLQLTGRKEHLEGTRTDYQGNLEPVAPAANGTSPQTQVNVAIGGGDAGTSGHAGHMGKGSATTRTEKVTADNTYEATTPTKVTLADRQTVRDIERLFGRPLRVGGAKLADQRIAAQLIADHPVDHFIASSNEAARKDREALAKVADVVLEVLITSRPLTLAGISGDQSYTVPDIQVTAVRLSDGAILGQASATDVMGKDRDAGVIVRTFDVNDIAEATALALMEDITITNP